MGHETRIGAYLDPIADKVSADRALFMFRSDMDSRRGGSSGSSLAATYDPVLGGAGFLWKGIRDFPPTIWGKLSTLLQIATRSR